MHIMNTCVHVVCMYIVLNDQSVVVPDTPSHDHGTGDHGVVIMHISDISPAVTYMRIYPYMYMIMIMII
jgi:hypothetical protein